MFFFSRSLLFLITICLFLGCKSNKRYDIGSDKAVADLSTRIKSLEEDLKTLEEDLGQVKKVLNDPDLDADLRASIRREIHEGERHIKDINQWVNYLKVRRKARYLSLVKRKEDPKLMDEATDEVRAYFLDKKLNPIKRPWKDRYRTAIEL